MLETLKFVQGAISKKDHVPELTHFHIANGRISGYNGKMRISAPIALDVDCCPKAEQFAKAIAACESTVNVQLTPTGRLSVKSGKFKANIDTVAMETYPAMEPVGQIVECHGIVEAMRALVDFVSEDASRYWSTGILFEGQTACATNNVIIAQQWLGAFFPFRINVPRYAIKELIRIGEEPTHVQLTANTAVFHFTNDRWLMCQLIGQEWPDVSGYFDKMPPLAKVPACPEALWPTLETLKPFVDAMGHVYAVDGNLATAREDALASIEMEGCPQQGIYNHSMLSLLSGVALHIDFDSYPDPMPWYGGNIRGVFVGMRT